MGPGATLPVHDVVAGIDDPEGLAPPDRPAGEFQPGAVGTAARYGHLDRPAPGEGDPLRGLPHQGEGQEESGGGGQDGAEMITGHHRLRERGMSRRMG